MRYLLIAANLLVPVLITLVIVYMWPVLSIAGSADLKLLIMLNVLSLFINGGAAIKVMVS